MASAPDGDGQNLKVERRTKDRVWSKVLDHPVWTTFGALVGIVGLVISVVQVIQSLQTPSASLELAALTIDGQQSIPGVVVNGGGSEAIRSIALTPVELTLQNTGGEPSLITRIDAEVVYFRQLKDCTFTQTTSGVIAAKYQLPVPMNGAEPSETQLSTEIRFEVKPHAADRMIFTFGPQSQPAFDATPMVMSAKIKLIHDDGVMDVGTVSLVTTVDAANAQITALGEPPSPIARSCAKENVEALDTMFAIQARRSTLLDTLRSVYLRAAA